jgi:hypothetical protein
MATSDILGLFTTPEQYQLAQQQAQQAQAIQYANLDPMARANYGTFRAGQQLGGAIGGALGGEDPQLKMISMRQQLASQLDPTNLDSYKLVAQDAANRGDTQFAMAVADAGRQAAVQIAQANKEKQLAVPARIQESQQAAVISQAIRQYKTLPQTPEITQTIENLQLQLDFLSPKTKAEATPNEIQIAQEFALQKGAKGTPEFNTEFNAQLTRLTTKEPKDVSPNVKEVGVAEGTRAPVYLDVVKDEQFTYQKGADGKQIRVPYIGGVDRTTAKVSASASSQGETEFSKELGKADAKKVEAAMVTRDNSIGALNSLNRLNQLNQQDLISGSFATGRVGATNLLSTLGLVSSKDMDKLSASENYQKTAGDVILATLGGKLGAGFSNEDRKFIQSLVPQLENSPQARKQLIEFMVAKNQSIVEETTRLENYARDNKSLKGYLPKIPIVNLQGGSNKPPSQMTRQELLDAIEAKKRQPQ